MCRLCYIVVFHTAISCEALSDPSNGRVEVNSLAFESVAEYSCNTGYELDGDSERECGGEGTWSGIAPLCRSKSMHIVQCTGILWILNKTHEMVLCVWSLKRALMPAISVCSSFVGSFQWHI